VLHSEEEAYVSEGTWSRRLRCSTSLRWRWKITWSRRLLRRMMVRRMTVRRRRVQDRGRPAAGQLHVS
jgi:hypothetical protein